MMFLSGFALGVSTALLLVLRVSLRPKVKKVLKPILRPNKAYVPKKDEFWDN